MTRCGRSACVLAGFHEKALICLPKVYCAGMKVGSLVCMSITDA
jgi:hypothetical protein